MDNEQNDKVNADRLALLQKLNLVNPDEVSNFNYNFPHESLQRMLGSLLYDEYFLIQASTIIKPSYFPDRGHQAICKIILDYYNKYNGKPDTNIIETELTSKYQNEHFLPYYIAELESISFAYEPGIDKREFFLDKITHFAKTQAIRTAFGKSIDILQKSKVNDGSTWQQIKDILEQAMLVERNVDLGLDYFGTIHDRYERALQMKEDNEFFSTGFGPVDEALSGGLRRGELAAFAGMSGSGKSIALANVAKKNILDGKNVLYISLEMDQDKVAERLDALFTNVGIKDLYLQRDLVEGILTQDVEGWGQCYIKQFPAGSADVNTVRAFLHQLAVKGFNPDVLIVDYIGEFKDFPGLKTYESRQRLVRDLRGLCTELKIAGYTALQINRGGRDALKEQGYLDDDSLADSQGQIRPLDCLYTISQTEVEFKASVGTLFVSKHRSGKSRFTIRFRRNPQTLQMMVISEEEYKIAISAVTKKAVDEVQMELMAQESDIHFQRNGGIKN